eukprot:s7_g11.t1
MVSLPEKGSKVIQVCDKGCRLSQLSDQVRELRESLGAQLSRSKVESLKGRLLYAGGHTYGRCTQLACHSLHKLGSAGPSVLVTADLVHATADALSILLESKPRMIDAWSEIPPILIFTDGAVEEESSRVTHGAFFIDPWKGQSFFFVEVWQRSGKKQVIAQSEIFPVVTSKDAWKDQLSGRSVLWFLDNESAKATLGVQARNWYCRVPSKSNPSDDASRLEFSAYHFSEQATGNFENADVDTDGFSNSDDQPEATEYGDVSSEQGGDGDAAEPPAFSPEGMLYWVHRRMVDTLTGEHELSSDNESPRSGLPVDAREQLIRSSAVVHSHLIVFLENTTWECGFDLLTSFGEALRTPEPAPMDESEENDDDDDEIMGPGETENEEETISP